VAVQTSDDGRPRGTKLRRISRFKRKRVKSSAADAGWWRWQRDLDARPQLGNVKTSTAHTYGAIPKKHMVR
jgi:hypothetical protein